MFSWSQDQLSTDRLSCENLCEIGRQTCLVCVKSETIVIVRFVVDRNERKCDRKHLLNKARDAPNSDPRYVQIPTSGQVKVNQVNQADLIRSV